MFNQAGFNQVPFNRDIEVDIYFSATAIGAGLLTGSAAIDMQLSATALGVGVTASDFVRDITQQALAVGVGQLAGDYVRDMEQGAKAVGVGALLGRIRKTHVEAITISGEFGPGKKLIIDTRKMRVTLDGQLIGYDGEFFNLHPGENIITYQDAATGRTVHCRVLYRDRYL